MLSWCWKVKPESPKISCNANVQALNSYQNWRKQVIFMTCKFMLSWCWKVKPESPNGSGGAFTDKADKYSFVHLNTKSLSLKSHIMDDLLCSPLSPEGQSCSQCLCRESPASHHETPGGWLLVAKVFPSSEKVPYISVNFSVILVFSLRVSLS